MVTKRNAIQKLLDKLSTPLLAQRFDDSLAELVADEHTFYWSEEDLTEIQAQRVVPGQGTYRAALPRADYPDLYALKDEARRLDALAREIRREEHRKREERRKKRSE